MLAPPATPPSPPCPATEHLLDLLPETGAVYVAGASGAPTAFMDALLGGDERTRGLELLTTYVPGINALDPERLHAGARITGLFMQPRLARAQREGRYRALPLSYTGFVRHLQDGPEIGLAVVQLAPPDAAGRYSLGPAVEFMPTVLRRSRRVLGIVNHRTPRIAGAPSLPRTALDHVVELDAPLPTYAAETDPTTECIAQHVATLVDDGDALQLGLGKVPQALMRLLREKRRLRLHSGMLGDGLAELQAAGALDPDFRPTACVLVGSPALYRWAAESDLVRLAGCETTHHPGTLLALDRFVAVNSALQVDLFGQCNLEHANGQAISAAGGAPDFARGARLAPRGRSVVALNATHHGQHSRIVPCLPERAVATLSRHDIDHVVTEHGVARLAGLSVHERARALIGVAAPAFRAPLEQAWAEIAARL